MADKTATRTETRPSAPYSGNNRDRAAGLIVEPLLDERQLADILNVSHRTPQHWRQSGKGPPYVKLDGEKGPVRYVPAEVNAWLAARTVASTSAQALALPRAGSNPTDAG